MGLITIGEIHLSCKAKTITTIVQMNKGALWKNLQKQTISLAICNYNGGHAQISS